jgi:hypothetical protein
LKAIDGVTMKRFINNKLPNGMSRSEAITVDVHYVVTKPGSKKQCLYEIVMTGENSPP